VQDLLAFNCLTWLLANENPVVNYPIENITVSRVWMVHIPVSSCKDGHSWIQLASCLIWVVFMYMESMDTKVKKKKVRAFLFMKYRCGIEIKANLKISPLKITSSTRDFYTNRRMKWHYVGFFSILCVCFIFSNLLILI
jgi:hypothetical protein